MVYGLVLSLSNVEWFTVLGLFVIAALLLGAYQPITRPPQTQSTPPAAMEVFVKGAPVRFSVGLAVGPDGNLYVGGRVSPWLSVVNPDTGEIVKRYGAQDGVDVPCDLAFGPDGSLYWTRYPGLLGDGVQRMAPDGTITGTTLPPYPWPVFVTKAGRLFVAQGLAPNTLWELDPNLQAPARQLMSDNSIFIHFTEGPDGKLYALKWFAGEIIRFDPDTPEQVETVATGLTLPFNLAFDSKGQLYLIIGVDSSTDAVARLDLASGKPEILATMHNLLYGLAIDSKDRIFVSSVSDGAIFEVSSKGDVRMVTPGGMILPGGIEVVARADGESLFLADWIAWREYDVATGALRSQAHSTWRSGGLVYPDTIAHFGDNLVIVSSETGQILIWDPEQQKQVFLLNEPGVDNAIVFADQLVAANYTTKEVTQFDPAAPEQRVVLASDMEYPLGLAANRGNLYVGDYVAGQILQVVADGAKLDPPKRIADGLDGPEGLALTADGRLLVVESGSDRLSAVDLSSGAVSQIAGDLGVIQQGSPTIRQHYLFNGVAVSPSGMIFVTADDTNVIYRAPLPPR